MTARDEVLRRVRQALRDTPSDVVVPRAYRRADGRGRGSVAVVDLLAERLVDYGARVSRVLPVDAGAAVRAALLRSGAVRVVVPFDLPEPWRTGWQGPEHELHLVPPSRTARELDGMHAVVTACRIAVAETGTVVLDAGPGQGPRVLSLVPDHHVVVLRAEDVVATVPDAVAVLDPLRPLTWVSGPSATSDIELSRVEGVHGPRVLDVVVLESAR